MEKTQTRKVWAFFYSVVFLARSWQEINVLRKSVRNNQDPPAKKPPKTSNGKWTPKYTRLNPIKKINTHAAAQTQAVGFPFRFRRRCSK